MKGLTATAFIILAGLVTVLAPPTGVAGMVSGKVIRFSHDIPDATYLSQHAKEMEKSGLDGVVVDFTRRFTDEQGKQQEDRAVCGQWIGGAAIKREELQHNVAALKSVKFSRFTDNFLHIRANGGPSGPSCFFRWDKAQYPDSPQRYFPDDPDIYLRAFHDNMVLAAQLCKEAGLKGFFIDQEAYGSWTQMRSDFPLQAFGEPIDRILARARDNVASVFHDVCEVYPDITIILIPGGCYRPISSDDIQLLQMAFTDGILQGLGPQARLFDGQEKAYDLTLYERFVQLRYNTRQRGLKYTTVPELYQQRMKYGFGVWLDHRSRAHGGFFSDPRLNHFTAEEFGNALHYALRASDGYVWVYSEQSIMWPSGYHQDATPNVADAYYEAIANCHQTRPINLGRDPRGADQEPLPPPAATIKTAGDTFATATKGQNLELIMPLKDNWQIWIDREDRGLWSLMDEVLSEHSLLPWRPIKVGEFWERQGYQYNGYAWYRTTFQLPKEFEGRQIFLVLGALGNKCQVYVNHGWAAMECLNPAEQDAIQQQVSSSSPDYTQALRPYNIGPVVLNLSKYGKLKFGADNLLCIYVINSLGPGGLWKPVWLAAGGSAK